MAILTRNPIEQWPALESVERPQSGKNITMALGQ